MRNLWFITLILLITGCSGLGNTNTRSFVATPVPDEISMVTYSIKTSADTNTWKLTNDDLRIRFTSRSRTGRVMANNVRKMTPNDYNWVIYNLEQANFTKVSSAPTRRQSQGNESLQVITQSDTYTYTQNSNSRFPNGFQKVVAVIPGLVNAR